jgi:hypothetical protein
MGARKLLAQALGIALNLFGVFGLELKGGDGGLKFLLELGVGVILEFDSPAEIGKLFVILTHKFEIGLALRVGTFQMSAKPARKVTATKFIKGGAVEVLIHC